MIDLLALGLFLGFFIILPLTIFIIIPCIEIYRGLDWEKVVAKAYLKKALEEKKK